MWAPPWAFAAVEPPRSASPNTTPMRHAFLMMISPPPAWHIRRREPRQGSRHSITSPIPYYPFGRPEHKMVATRIPVRTAQDALLGSGSSEHDSNAARRDRDREVLAIGRWFRENEARLP